MKQPIHTLVPGLEPIELVAYYDEFTFYYERCELDTKQWFVEHAGPSWTYLDCGANIGYYSILFSRLSPEGRIYAFEPTSTRTMLDENLRHHGIKNVEVVPKALGKASGLRSDAVFRIWGRDPEVAEYDFVTIDEFVESQGLTSLDCIKIDVDSFDFEVLQGAERTLARFDPFVMVEINHALARRNFSPTQVYSWLMERGYDSATVYDQENHLLKRSLCAENKTQPSFALSIA